MVAFIQLSITALLSLTASSLTPNDGITRATTTAEYTNLLNWMKTSFPTSYVHPSFSIAPTTVGGEGTINHGGFTTSRLSKDDLILRVPAEACITSKDIVNDADCGKVFQKIIEKAGPGGFTVCFAGFLAKEVSIITIMCT